MMIILKQSLYYQMTDDQIDRLIEEHFGKEYSCVVAEAWNNDSSHVIHVDLQDYDSDQREAVQDFVKGTDHDKWGQYNLSWLLNDLAYREIIPEGKYLIEVCW